MYSFSVLKRPILKPCLKHPTSTQCEENSCKIHLDCVDELHRCCQANCGNVCMRLEDAGRVFKTLPLFIHLTKNLETHTVGRQSKWQCATQFTHSIQFEDPHVFILVTGTPFPLSDLPDFCQAPENLMSMSVLSELSPVGEVIYGHLLNHKTKSCPCLFLYTLTTNGLSLSPLGETIKSAV